jgi:hypothetical protein
LSRTSSVSNTLRRLSLSTISCMKPLGAVLSRPWPSFLARSARRAARILSRSVAMTCMRVLRRSRDSTGINTVSVVANAATEASSVTTICGVRSEMI